MKIYTNLFLGFYCMVKKALPGEDNAEAYAIGFLSGAACFFYFTITILFFGSGAGLLETAGVFFVAYGIHHFMFADKGLGKEIECSDKYIYRSLLYFFTALSLLMFAATKLAN